MLHKLLLLRTKKVAQSWTSRWERGVDDGNSPTYPTANSRMPAGQEMGGSTTLTPDTQWGHCHGSRGRHQCSEA